MTTAPTGINRFRSIHEHAYWLAVEGRIVFGPCSITMARKIRRAKQFILSLDEVRAWRAAGPQAIACDRSYTDARIA